MPVEAPNIDQFELYFKRADLDQDGRVSGPEAVTFFQSSGLSKPVLAQIWAFADQNRSGYLGRAEFYNALKLVTVAQSKRDLTPNIVKAALYGHASSKIPPPQIKQPTQSPLPNTTLQPQHGANHVLPGGTTHPPGSTRLLQKAAPKSNVLNPASQFSPSQPFPSQSNVSHQPSANQNQSTFSQQVVVQNLPVRAENIQSSQPWPKMTQSSLQKYTKVFMEVDTDRDGKVTGEQARNLFLSWKLPREILKQVWELSDEDNDSMLSLKEFCIALYLMERFRENRPLPKVLPPNIFQGQPPPAYGQRPPPPPGVQQPHAMSGPRQASRPPRPVLDEQQPKHTIPVLEKHLLDQLTNEEQKSLNSKFQEATEADKKVGELEKEISEAKQKIEFYRNKMQEIVLYKSRCDSRLNEITERVSADKREVELLSKKYEDKCKQAGDVASKLTIEEATFRHIQDKKMELYSAIVKLDQDGKPDDIQARADGIQADLEEQVKTLNERCKMYGLHGKPTSLVELPFGWQSGIEQGAADWDEDWDKFEDEGFTFVEELTLDVKNVIAPPKPKCLPPVHNKSTIQDNADAEKPTVADDKTKTRDTELDEKKQESSVKTDKIFNENNTSEDDSPHPVKTHSEHSDSESGFDEAGAGFDTSYDSDATLDFNAKESSLFDSDSDGWGLNPIKAELPRKSTFTFDSVPSSPAYSYGGGTFQQPFSSTFADSVPTTPTYNDAGLFSRFDSFCSSAQDSEYDNQGLSQPQTLTRFDSMHSTADSDFGHSLFHPQD